MENQKTRKEIRDEIVAGMIGVGLVLLTGTSVAAALYCHRQMKKTVRLMSVAANSVADLTVVDVRQSIVDRAIDNVANREVSRVVNRAVRTVEDTLANETQKRVRSAVQQSYGKLQKTVAESIAKEAAKVDRAEIMREATERAKEAIVEKFDGKLDDLLSDYNRNLENVGKIYQSIASSMADKAGKDVTLKIG